MSNPAIKAEHLSKRYRIGAQRGAFRYGSLRESLTNALKAPFRRLVSGRQRSETIWALKDVSFEIEPGEVVGIIGRNGAGKTTLLKILSRITEPTEGRVEIRGRVGSLLEVGTGFHPELTGRENIYLNGAILGMTRREINRKFDEIVAFAELEKFLDTPVKRYSSGMYVRLAFAVAAHLDPEILLVDEVLAVGDAAFQKKCLGKMDAVAKSGRTVLFVSHNMGAVARLCKKCFWLDEGQIVLNGASADVINKYQSKYLNVKAEWRRQKPVELSDDFAFTRITVGGYEKSNSGIFSGDEPIPIEIEYVVNRQLSGCQVGVRLCNSEGLVVFTTGDSDSAGVSALPKSPGQYKARFVVSGNFLAPGTYYIVAGAHLPGRQMYDLVERAVVFEVSSSSSVMSLDDRLGVVAPLIHWDTICGEIAP